MISGRARLTVCAAAASLMAGFALLPLTASGAWFFKAVLMVCLQAGVGALARRVPLARPLTVLVQALISLIVLTMMFATRQALGGILPGPDAIRRLNQVVQDGITDVSNFSIPAPVTPGIRMLLIGGVVVIALAVDAIAVTYNSAAPAGLPLLALYSVAAGLAHGGARWLYFVVAGSGYLLLLLAEGRDRLSRWGRVFTSTPQGAWAGGPASASAGGAAPVRTGRRIGAMALGIALVAPAVLPSLGSGLLDTTGHGNGNGIGGGGGGSVNLVAALQDNLNQPDNREVLTYATDNKDVSGMYLRIAALDKFDGKEWRPSHQPTEAVPAVMPLPQGMSTQVKYESISTRVQVSDTYVQGLLPMPFPALSVQATGNWVYQPEGRMLIGEHGQTAAGVHYTVTSMAVEPTPAQLAAAPRATGEIAEQYTQVPDSLPAVVKETALRETRGAANDYERALDLQRFFTSGEFVYNTEAKSGSGVDAIARFLRTKEGFCVHFAFTMAAMARTLGIPARVAIGFTPGSPNAHGVMTVGLKDAHAWPELYFQGIGWTRFEPTPYRGTAPSYTQTPSSGGGDTQRDTSPHGSRPTATATPSAGQSCAPDHRDQQSTDCGAKAVAPTGGSGGGTDGGSAVLVALAALLVLMVPTAPAMWRSRVRARRLGRGGHRPEGATLAAWHEVLDSGWDYGVLPDDSETPRRAMNRLVSEGGLSGEAATAAGALATAVEETLYAPRPRPAEGLAANVHRVRTGLRSAANRRTRLRAFLLPRSLTRLAWAFSARWTAITARTSAATHRLTTPLRRKPHRTA